MKEQANSEQHGTNGLLSPIRQQAGAARAALHAIYDHQTEEHARAAAIKWQDRLLLCMRQLIMLNVVVCNRVLELTQKFTDARYREAYPDYAAIYRREVKRAINELERTVKEYRAGVLKGIDDDWRDSYEDSQAAYTVNVMQKDLMVLWYSLRNALLKEKFEFAEPLIELYYCMGLMDISAINTDWRKEELHKLDASFDLSFRWDVFDINGGRKRMKQVMYLLTPKGCRDRSLPLYPDEFPYNFMDCNEQTKTACNIVLWHSNDVDRILPCLVPEELARQQAVMDEMLDWFDEQDLKLTMENADGWKRTSPNSLEGKAVAQVMADYEARKAAVAEERKIFDPVAAWQELTEKAEEQWQRRYKHNRAIDAQYMEAMHRLHPDWTEEQYQKEADSDSQTAAAILTEPRIEVLRQRILEAEPQEVTEALKPKRRRKKKAEASA